MEHSTETAEARRVVMSLHEHRITDPDRVEPLLHDDFKLRHRADPRHTPRAAAPMDKATYMAGLRIVHDAMTQPDGSPGMKITIVEVLAEGNKVMVEIEAEASLCSRSRPSSSCLPSPPPFSRACARSSGWRSSRFHTWRGSRARTLRTAPAEFVAAARGLGARRGRVLLREILPVVSTTVTAYAGVVCATLILAESSLSFLGLGVPPPRPSWGNMIAEGRASLQHDPHIVFEPVIVLFLTILSMNTIGEWLRRRSDSASRLQHSIEPTRTRRQPC